MVAVIQLMYDRVGSTHQTLKQCIACAIYLEVKSGYTKTKYSQ